MKHCSYCNTDYDISIEKCPSCDATQAHIKCDNCGFIHNNKFCPKCGMGINEKLKECPKCGHKSKERICPKCGYDYAAIDTIKGVAATVVSKAACKLGGHKWLGCKCTICGNTRDEDHTFNLILGKCEQKCSVCGKIEKVPHRWNDDKCDRCGAVKPSASKFFKSANNVLHLEKKPNKITFIVVIALLFLFSCARAMSSPSQNSPQNVDVRLKMPASSSSYNKKNYSDVIAELEQVGFTNITTVTLDDLVTGWITKDGEIEKISVDGKESFSSNSRFQPDVAIVITYHTFPEKKEASVAKEPTPEPVTEEKTEAVAEELVEESIATPNPTKDNYIDTAEYLDLNAINATSSVDDDKLFVGKAYSIKGIVSEAMPPDPDDGSNALIVIHPDVIAKGMGAPFTLDINIWLTTDEFDLIGGESSVGREIEIIAILTSISRNAMSKDLKGYPIELEFGEPW